VSFAAIILCVASRRVFIVVGVYFVIDSVRKLLDTLLMCTLHVNFFNIIYVVFILRKKFIFF